MSNELIITNATVMPMTEPGERAEALAVSDTRIVAVGNAACVGMLAGKDAKVIDADGRIVFPGFIEPYASFSWFAKPAVFASGHSDLLRLRLAGHAPVAATRDRWGGKSKT